MNLNKKKELAARTLGVGRERISFNTQRLDEVNKALTKGDIRQLYAEEAIFIKEIKGRKKVVRRKNRRKAGSKRKNKISKKRLYVVLTRKLRKYLLFLKKKNKITPEQFIKLRKEIRASQFKNLGQLKGRIEELEK